MSNNQLVELDAVTLDAIRQLLSPIVQKVVSRYFDDSTSYPEEIASEVEDELIASIQVPGRREGKLNTLVGGEGVYRVGEVKRLLKDIPDERMILSQIVGSESGVYNAYFELGILKNGDGPVIMSAGHPQLTHLPMDTVDAPERQQHIDRLIDGLNQLR